jgi:hypothetical protein
MMSTATEFAIFKLQKGDRKAAEKRLLELSETRQVKEYLELDNQLAVARGSVTNAPPAGDD